MAYRAPLQEIPIQQIKNNKNVNMNNYQQSNNYYHQSKMVNNAQQRFVLCHDGKALGSGAYGTVYPAFDRYLNKSVAIKVIKPQSNNALLCPTTIREIGLLKQIKHKNIITLLNMNQEIKTSTIYLIFERADYDLKKFWTKHYDKNGIINKCNNNNNNKYVITLPLIQNIIKQIITGISFLHSINIIHRDIKPQNILLFVDSDNNGNNEINVKLADFGLARSKNETNLSLTVEVVTLWYRPIELLLGCNNYNMSVDIWAIGCVLYELITNQPLFPAMCQIETIFKIFQILGTPLPSNDINNNNDWNLLQKLKHFQSKFPKFKKISWFDQHEIFRNINNKYKQNEIIDLLNKLIQLNPNKRISAKNALNHSFFKS